MVILKTKVNQQVREALPMDRGNLSQTKESYYYSIVTEDHIPDLVRRK